ncbi:MAG: hypothetical protein JXA36_00575 [Coriobacteriia bacterium]|nr:hypothetical protein [Coriobacteriia bacterium]
MIGRLDREGGFAVTTLLLITGVATAVIVGGSSTAASVMNQADVREAADQMSYVASDIRARTQYDRSAEAQALGAHATAMYAVSGALTRAADEDVLVNVRNNAGDVVMTPLQGGAVIDVAKFAWDLKGGWELGDTALKSWGLTDRGADPLIAQLQGLQPARDYTAPAEQAIVEAKLKAGRAALVRSDPGLSPEEIDSLAGQLVIDIEAGGATASAGGDEYRNRYVDSAIAQYLGWTPPDDVAAGDGGAAAGDAVAGNAQEQDASADVDAGEWMKFLFAKPGTYWPGSPNTGMVSRAIRDSAQAFLGLEAGTTVEVLAIGPTDAEGSIWPVRFRLVPPGEDSGMVFLTLVYPSDDGMFASPIFMPDVLGTATAAFGD